MMIKLLRFVFVLFLLNSCTAYKKVPYLIEAESISNAEMQKMAVLQEQYIMPGDLLTIVVNSTVPEAALPFNIPLVPQSTSSVAGTNTVGQLALQTYLVDPSGNIDFPVIGRLHIGGMSKKDVEQLIKTKIYPAYITDDPIITIRFVNYKISVLGEVNRPNIYTIPNERVNIFEALALAGDMTIYARRDNVMLMRQLADGKKQVIRLNLQDKNLLLSPYFFLQQNDVVYVEPNKSKGNTRQITASETIIFSILGSLLGIANLLITILK